MIGKDAASTQRLLPSGQQITSRAWKARSSHLLPKRYWIVKRKRLKRLFPPLPQTTK
jgi:hypothetical protein